MWRTWCVVLLVGLSGQVDGDPSPGYEKDLAPGGHHDLARPIVPYPYRLNSWVVSPDYVRRLYDAVGLPEAGSTEIRNAIPSNPGRYTKGFTRLSPQIVKRSLLDRGLHIEWELWEIRFFNTIEIEYTVGVHLLSGLTFPHPVVPGQYHTSDSYDLSQSEDLPQKNPGIGTGVVNLFTAHSGFRVDHGRSVFGIGTGNRTLTAPEPDVLHFSAFQDTFGKITPEVKLKDLKELAPWFYEYLPEYVIARSDWFDKNRITSVSVLAEDGDSPHMVEISGWFRFEGQERGNNFDDHFSPETFHRTHIRDHAPQRSLVRPCRKNDVLVVHNSHNGTGIRFMVDPRYDPQPELRYKSLDPRDSSGSGKSSPGLGR